MNVSTASNYRCVSVTLTFLALQHQQFHQKKTHHLFFLRRHKGVSMNTSTLVMLCFGSLTVKGFRLLQKTVKTATEVFCTEFPSLQYIFTTRYRTKAQSIILDAMHSVHVLFTRLHSALWQSLLQHQGQKHSPQKTALSCRHPRKMIATMAPLSTTIRHLFNYFLNDRYYFY